MFEGFRNPPISRLMEKILQRRLMQPDLNLKNSHTIENINSSPTEKSFAWHVFLFTPILNQNKTPGNAAKTTLTKTKDCRTPMLIFYANAYIPGFISFRFGTIYSYTQAN